MNSCRLLKLSVRENRKFGLLLFFLFLLLLLFLHGSGSYTGTGTGDLPCWETELHKETRGSRHESLKL